MPAQTSRRDHAATEWIMTQANGVHGCERAAFEAGWAAAMAEPLEPEACRVPEKRGLHVGYPHAALLNGERATDVQSLDPPAPLEGGHMATLHADLHLAPEPDWRDAIRLADEWITVDTVGARLVSRWRAHRAVVAALRGRP